MLGTWEREEEMRDVCVCVWCVYCASLGRGLSENSVHRSQNA